MNDTQHTFELHHCIEQNNVFDRSPLLQELTRQGLYDIDSSRNTIYLPSEKALGAELGVSPHPGGHLQSYTKIVVDELEKVESGADWQAYAETGDDAAIRRVAQAVNKLEDTLKTALVNGDLYTNNTRGMTNVQVRSINESFASSVDAYQVTHAAQIAQIGRLDSPEAQWVSVLQSEQQALRATQLVNRAGYKPAGGDEFEGHASLRKAINQAHAGGRLAVSERTVNELRQAFAPHVAEAEAREANTVARQASGRASAIKAIASAGMVVGVAGAAEAGEQIASSLDRDNPLAAKSQAMHLGGRGAGGVVGGAAAGLVAGAWTGPGALVTVAVGAYVGSEAGEKVAKWWDNRQVYHQRDRADETVTWEFTGRQWVRERPADLNRDGESNSTTFAAPPEKVRELNLAALNAATALELGNVPRPRSPFIQPEAPGDTPSLDPASWERNSRTGQWERNVVVGRIDRAANDIRPEIASPQRAVELERAADQIIRENIAAGPAPIAARYEIAFRANGFDSVGEKLPAATTALAQGFVTASNGELYRRDDSGQWLSQRGTPASGNLPAELERTNTELAPQLAQHRQYVAALSPIPQPPAEDRDRAILLDTYQQRGVSPTQEQMDAAMIAVARTRATNGIAPGMTTFRIEPNAEQKYDVRSPIAHVFAYSDGVVRVAAETTTADIAQALAEVRNRPAPIPDTPELRIETLSPQQREAREQALREANRLGLSRDDVQLTAQQAAAAAAIMADREPEIVTRPLEAARLHAQPKPDTQREPTPPSPAPSEPPPPAPKVEPAPIRVEAEPDARAEDARKPVEPAQAPAVPQAARSPSSPQYDAQAAQAAPSGPDDALRRGSEGQDVALLQYRLDRMGYRGPGESPLPQHGQFDAATEHGVRQFQEVNKLPTTGVVDPETVHALAVAQQARAARPAPPREEVPEPAPERAPIAQDAAPEQLPAVGAEHRRSERAEVEEARQAVRVEPANPPPAVVLADSAPEARPKVELRQEPAIAAQQPTQAPVPSGSEPAPASIAPAQAAPVSPTASPERDEPAVQTAHGADRVEPQPSTRPSEPEPPADLSQFTREDRRMMEKIRAAVPGGLSDEHLAAAMLAAKRNGIQDADRLGPVAVVGDTLWMGGKVEGFHTAVNVAQQAPALQDTVRETAQFNYEQAQKLAQEQAQQQQQQNQEQTDKALKMSLM